MDAPLWRLIEVSVPGRGRPRLDRMTIEIPVGVTAVVGPSGAGKTTLLNLLVGFERPRSGTVESVKSYDPSETPGDSRGTKTNQTKSSRLPVFWVPPGHGLWPQLTVRQHLTSIAPDAAADIESLLDEFDLDHLSQAYPATLSQGERDRLSLARAIASGAETLVLDEPLAHVPDDAAERYWSRLRTIRQRHKMNLVMATHDIQVAKREAEYVIMLDAGRVTARGPAKELLTFSGCEHE